MIKNKELIPIYLLVLFFILFTYLLFFTDYLPTDNLLSRIGNPFENKKSDKDEAPNFLEHEISTINFRGAPINPVDSISINNVSNTVYAVLNGSSIIAINGSNDQVIKEIDIPGKNGYYNVVVNPIENKVYLLSNSSELYVLDAKTDSIDKIELNQAAGVETNYITVNPKTNRIYLLLSHQNDESILVIDGNSKEIIKTIEGIGDAQAIAINPNTDKLYVSDDSRKSLIMIQGSMKKSISNIKIDNQVPNDMVVDTNRDIIYASYPESNRIVTIDGITDQLISTSLSGNFSLYFPPELEYDPLHNILYSRSGQELSVLNDSKTVTSIQFDSLGVDKMAVNPQTHKIYLVGVDGNLYVMNFGSSNNVKSNDLDTGIKVKGFPNLVEVDPSQKAYLLSTSEDEDNYFEGYYLSTIERINKDEFQTKLLGQPDSNLPIEIMSDPLKNIVYNRQPNGVNITNSSSGEYIKYIDNVGFPYRIGFSNSSGITVTSYANIVDPYTLEDFGPYMSMAISDFNRILYVSSNDSITEIDLSNNTIVNKISLLKQYGLSADILSRHVPYSTVGSIDKLYFLDRSFPNYNGSVLGELETRYDVTSDSSLKRDHNLTKKIFLDQIATALAVDRKNMIAYITNPEKNSVSAIDLTTGKIINSILVGELPWDIEINMKTNMIYVSNRNDNTVSIIDGFNYYPKILSTVPVGKNPGDISIDPKNNIIYVANSESNTISLIDGYTNKPIIMQGVTFNIDPPNSGHITCNGKETPIKSHFLPDLGIICNAIPNEGYVYNSWLENFEDYPSKTILTSLTSSKETPGLFGIISNMNDGNINGVSLNVTNGGNFTATFKSYQPLISEEALLQTYVVIIGAIISAWLMPYLLEKLKLRRQHQSFRAFEIEISRVFKNVLDSNNYDTALFEDSRKRINESSVKGKISEMQHQILEKKISTCYHYILMKKLETAKGRTIKDDNLDSNVLDEIKDYITKEYVDGILNDLQYDRLTSKISEYESS